MVFTCIIFIERIDKDFIPTMFPSMLLKLNTTLLALLVFISKKQLTISSSFASSFQENNEAKAPLVEELNETTLLKTVNQPNTNLWLIAFYDPSCPHSQSLFPILDDIVSTTTSTTTMNLQMSIGKVDCSKNQNLCEDYNIQAYPTLKWYREGTFHEYDKYQGRKLMGDSDNDNYDHHDNFIMFAKQMNEYVFKIIDSYKDVLTLLDNDDESNGSTFIVYTKSKSDNNDHNGASVVVVKDQNLEEVARHYQDKNTFIALKATPQNDKWMKQYTSLDDHFNNNKKKNGNRKNILMKIEKDTNPIVFRDFWSKELLRNFIESNREKVVPLVTQHTLYKYGLQGKNLVIAILDLERRSSEETIVDATTNEEILPRLSSSSLTFLSTFRQIASSCPYSLKREYRFVYMVSGRKELLPRQRNNDGFLEKFSISLDDSSPQVLVLDYPNDIYWKFDHKNATTTTTATTTTATTTTTRSSSALSKSNIERFLLDIMRGEILSQNPNILDMNNKERIHGLDYNYFKYLEENQWILDLRIAICLIGLALLIPQSNGKVSDLVEHYIWGGLIDPLLCHFGLMGSDDAIDDDEKEDLDKEKKD